MAAIPQARIHGIDDLRVDMLASPDCGNNDVVVEVRQCGICGSDLGYLGMGGLTAPGIPMPIGHELWGVVREAGANVSHVATGDAVVVQPMSNGLNIGNGGAEGGFTPLLLVRDAALHTDSTMKLPSEIPLEYAALVEPLAVAQHSANRVQAQVQDTAVIYGGGPIGLSILQVLQYRNLSDIVVVDLSEKRLQAARDMGAIALRGDDPQLSQKLMEMHGSSDFFGAAMPASSVLFEATGARAVFESMLQTAGPGSRICLTGVHKEPVSVDLVMLLAKEVSIIPAMGYQQEFVEVFEMLCSGRLNPAAMVTHEYPLSDLVTAFATARDTERAIKVMIDCQS